jgi:hypothetical protein
VTRVLQGRPTVEMYTRLLWETPAAALHHVSARSPAVGCIGCVLVPELACSSSDQQHIYVSGQGCTCRQLLVCMLLSGSAMHSKAPQ